ncbi:Os08g0231100 [Oryza sativa Japonica Group]|uniref:Os08g0231100 protein n=2 Tax=Oryza sativa subsp. japonica TaxID=39947 RepID=B7EAT7_ORYSJ|nr:hypothetical protein EE612_042913 [Oryza sativa]KAF2918690.1 hypothetical protein DAI22_08g075500 [Oryza sativa Japonica Group]BAG89484.1 unnamed protein product [Oryza sativa Japonica Group]BAH94177.1 Os08g0231100 [Oryza sativa Japonica Group]BAT04432.1 Os08g0231100 [Oryza sativa Japonica Group]|eukprot:NP_001175449.1 Os08g0231100 [Oryza sativa Japonica Group]
MSSKYRTLVLIQISQPPPPPHIPFHAFFSLLKVSLFSTPLHSGVASHGEASLSAVTRRRRHRSKVARDREEVLDLAGGHMAARGWEEAMDLIGSHTTVAGQGGMW